MVWVYDTMKSYVKLILLQKIMLKLLWFTFSFCGNEKICYYSKNWYCQEELIVQD